MAQSATWDFYVLEYARSKNQPWVDLVAGMYDDGVMDLPFSFVLLQRDGRNVLVDTGFMRQGDDPGFSGKFGVPEWMSPIRLLAAMDVRPGDVSDIVITHAHFDHMGSIGEFPNADIHIQKRELLSCYELFALPKRFSHLTAIVDPDSMRAALDASFEHRIHLIDGDRDDILPGVHARLGCGHTFGHQFVVVETAAGRRVVSGDCLYSRSQIAGRGGDGVYVPLNNAIGSAWDQLNTIDKVNDEIGGDLSRLVVLHDIDRWKGLPVVKEVEGFRIVKVA